MGNSDHVTAYMGVGGDDGERASGSPVFCSWLPNVISVSPSSASELLSTRLIQSHTRQNAS